MKFQVWNLTKPVSGYSVTSVKYPVFLFSIKDKRMTLFLQCLYIRVSKWAVPSCLHSLFWAGGIRMLQFFMCVCDAGVVFGSQRWECVIGSVVIQSWLSSLLNSHCADQSGPVWSDPNSLDAEGAGVRPGAESISISNLITIRSVPD